MSSIVIILLLIFFAYAFAGIIGFVPFLVGVIYNFFTFLIDLVAYNLYPVGTLPYILVAGTLIFLIVFFFIRLFTKNH